MKKKEKPAGIRIFFYGKRIKQKFLVQGFHFFIIEELNLGKFKQKLRIFQS